jgi:hypothetical protein
MRNINEVQVARAVTLIQEGWTFRRVSVDLNVSPSVIHHLMNLYDETGQLSRGFWQGRGCMTIPQDGWYQSIYALRRHSATARVLQQDLRRLTRVTVSDQTFIHSLKSPAPPLGYLGHSAHIPRSSSICIIHNMYRYSIQIQDGPVWSGLEN